MQYADLALYDDQDVKIPLNYAQGFNPGGSNPGGEGPTGGTDGNLNVKFLDSNFVPNGKSDMIFTPMHGPVRMYSYQFWTANDCPHRDPDEWTLFGGVCPLISSLFVHLVHWSISLLVHRSIGPFVGPFIGPFIGPSLHSSSLHSLVHSSNNSLTRSTSEALHCVQ